MEQIRRCFSYSQKKYSFSQIYFLYFFNCIYYFITLILSIATALIFQQFSLQIHIMIAIVGLLIGIMYVVLLLPAVYASGTFGITIVNILVLVLIMGGVYILQKTTLGLLFITWISNTNAFVLIVTSCILIALISIVSMIISTKVYSNTFE